MNVLIIDDQASQRKMLRCLIEDISTEIKVTDFSDPVHALLWTQKEQPDLVILDYRMPKMDGLEFARRFRRPFSQRDVPIVLVTVVGDEPLRQAALDAGVIDFMVKPVRPRELRSRCKNLLELRQRQQSLKTRTYQLERRLLAGMHEMEHREHELLTRLARAVELREGRDRMWLERISRYAGVLAEGIGMSDDDIRLIEQAAPLHDIGNIGVPDQILLKQGKLTDAERLVMMTHTQRGYELLRDSSSRFIQMGAEIALGHHERWDGSGYPQALRGEQTPMPARIVGVADVIEALTTARSDRDALRFERVLEYMRSQAGHLFDPEIVKVLLVRGRQVDEVRKAFKAGQPASP